MFNEKRPEEKKFFFEWNKKKIFLRNGQKKAKASVDERYAFPLKLIAITYQPLICVCCCTCDLPCMEMETMKCIVLLIQFIFFLTMQRFFYAIDEANVEIRRTNRALYCDEVGIASGPTYFTLNIRIFIDFI